MQVVAVDGPRTTARDVIAEAHGHLWIEPVVADAPSLTDPALAAAELDSFAEAGGALVVDCQPGFCGRNARMLALLAARSPRTAIVASTGFHLQRYYEAGAGPWAWTAERAAVFFTKELTDGMTEAPGLRAGVVKTAWAGRGGHGEELMRAALEAARVTGSGVVVHTEAGAHVEDLVGVAAAIGMAPGRVQLSHVDKRPDLELHRALARQGYVLGYDTFARPKYDPEHNVWPLLRAMIEHGLWGQVAIGLDIVDPSLWAVRGGPGLRAIPLSILGRLRGEGVDERVLAALGGGNVVRLLAAAEAY